MCYNIFNKSTGGEHMFAERFDALMNIAEVSNSRLGRAVKMNSSHIGRLRNGARPLPKKHNYLTGMCLYLAENIEKEYQRNALQKLTGIGYSALDSAENIARYLEQWLLECEKNTVITTGRLISGFSQVIASPVDIPVNLNIEEAPQKYAQYLYGNAGKRKAVEQFFLMILQEKKPQTLLLFSDENMAWLYEDPVFSVRWMTLFKQVILKGNRVRIIHTVSRDLNEFLEAITKWIPIYMTGMIEPYYYPRLRDGVFQRTMFIAPDTATIISSSVQQDTDGMLHIFLTNRAAIDALVTEYERYFMLCRPLMRIFTGQEMERLNLDFFRLADAAGDARLQCAMPLLFTMPESLAHELAEQTGSEMLFQLWERSFALFCRNIQEQHLTLTLLDPELALLTPSLLKLPLAEVFSIPDFTYTREQYLAHWEWLRELEQQYDNLTVILSDKLDLHTLLYVKDNVGVVMAKVDLPLAAFIISERNMVSAFWDYMEKRILI